MSKAIARVWKFASSSGSGVYETLQYEDGSTSCGCMGWCRRVAPDGSRSCKHTRAVDMGTADSECTSSHDYTSGQKAKAAPVVQKSKQKTTNPKPKFEQAVPARRVLWQ